MDTDMYRAGCSRQAIARSLRRATALAKRHPMPAVREAAAKEAACLEGALEQAKLIEQALYRAAGRVHAAHSSESEDA